MAFILIVYLLLLSRLQKLAYFNRKTGISFFSLRLKQGGFFLLTAKNGVFN